MVFQISFRDELLVAKSALVISYSLMNLDVVNKATCVLELLSAPFYWALILVIIYEQLQILPRSISFRFIWASCICIWLGIVILSVRITSFRLCQIIKVLLRKIESSFSLVQILLANTNIDLLLLAATTLDLIFGMNNF